MTDKQIVDIVLKRAKSAVKSTDMNLPHENPKIVITQQYGKKLYFNVKFENSGLPHLMSFSHNDRIMVFIMPELPERLMEWKADIIKKIKSSKSNCIEFDIKSYPKEIVHIFANAIISALNTHGMGIHIMTAGVPALFNPDETYEEVQIEADMLSFSEGEDF